MGGFQNDRKRKYQDDEYEKPYHYQDLFAVGQLIERISLFDLSLEKLNVGENSHILDLGCGDGRFCYHAKQFLKVSGVDISERALGWAKMFNPELEFHLGYLDKLNLGEFDGLVCLEVIEHISDDDISIMLKAIYDSVRSSGRVIISVPSVNQPLIKKHYKHYTAEMLEHLLSPLFSRVEVIGHSRIRSVFRPIFSLLNLISCLFYSDTFRWKFPSFVRFITSLKKKVWYRFLYTGPTEKCNRLVAICEKE